MLSGALAIEPAYATLCAQLVLVTCTVTQWTWNHFKVCCSNNSLASSSLSEDPGVYLGNKGIYFHVKFGNGALDHVLHFCLLNILRFKVLQNSFSSRFECTFIAHYPLACCLLYSGAISNIHCNKHSKTAALESGHTSPILHFGNDEKENGTCMKQRHLKAGEIFWGCHEGHSAVGTDGGCRSVFYPYSQEKHECLNAGMASPRAAFLLFITVLCNCISIQSCLTFRHFAIGNSMRSPRAVWSGIFHLFDTGMLVISLLKLLFSYYESVEKGDRDHFHITPSTIINSLIKLLLTVL